jgi:hypothetical protein
MRIRRRVILTAAVFGFGVWITTPATGGTGYAHQHLGTQCMVAETSYGSMVTAYTTWRISSGVESPNGYQWRARLIPSRPGLNFFRSWNEVEVPDVGSTQATGYDATVTTPPMSASLDWDLQVELTWERSNERDWHVEHVLPFDERACVPATAASPPAG